MPRQAIIFADLNGKSHISRLFITFILSFQTMKTIVFLIVCFLLPGMLNAGTVDRQQACTVARNFYFERSGQYKAPGLDEITISTVIEEKSGDVVACYAVNIANGGFVLVSATDKVRPVLAYSFTSQYDPEKAPPQFEHWKQWYIQSILQAMDEPGSADLSIFLEWNRLLSDDEKDLQVFGGKDVEPMLVSTWDQGVYYNAMCPYDPAGPAGHCVTGCVATAMAQLCYYFRFPQSGLGSYTYQHPDYGMIEANFGSTNYAYDAMVNSITSPNLAAATLIYHMGVSVDMDYGPDGSGMWNHKAAYSLRTYFKFSPETQYVFRDSTSMDWDSLIMCHLDRKIPMYYAGWSVPNVNGHAFILDGCQGDYYHFNWGWSGSFDGYFYTDNLNPGGNNFNLAQELIIEAFPDTNLYAYPYGCAGSSILTALNGSIDDGSGAVFEYENNLDCSWLISPQTIEDSVTRIIINFDRFNTEMNNDQVIIYDGENASAPVLGTYSGTTMPPANITSTGNKLFIRFITNGNVSDKGWSLNYKSVIPVWCNGITQITEPSGSFGDGSGNFYYHNGSTCMWNIQPPGATSITFTFLSFQTEEDKDIVKIYDAQTSQLLGTYSGVFEPGNFPDPVTCPHGKMLVTFATNPTENMQGWESSYTSIITGFDENLAGDKIKTWVDYSAMTLIAYSDDFKESDKIMLRIHDINGKMIFNELINPEQGFIRHEVETLSPGIYFFTVSLDHILESRRFIIW